MSVQDIFRSLAESREHDGSPAWVSYGSVREALTLIEMLKQERAAAILESNQNLSKIERLAADLEIERMRLAACGVVALANTRETAQDARTMAPEYRSDSLKAVESAVDREMLYREELQQVKAENAILRGIATKLMPCHYCGAETLGACPHGFPGCSLADDLFGAEDTMATEIQKLRRDLDAAKGDKTDEKIRIGARAVLEAFASPNARARLDNQWLHLSACLRFLREALEEKERATPRPQEGA